MTQALDLEYVVVARLRLPAPYGNTTAATACLIAPDRAVTLARLFVEGESVFGISIPLITEIDGRSEEHRATVVWTDWATNIALLAVSPPASVELPSYQHIFADTLAPPEASWRARLPRFHEDVAGPAIFYGTVVESSSSSEPGALRLRAKGEAYAPSIGLGTPVFSDYGVIGLIAGHREGNDLVAVPSLAIRQALEAHGHESAPAESRVKPQEPVSAAAESTGRSTTSSRRRTRGTPPRSKSTDSPESAKPAPLDAAALFDRLSVSSRRALAHANDLRARMGVDEVHMEHLILGLYQKDTGPTHRELHRVGITEAKLRERLNAIIEREIPPYRDAVPTLDALPPCSGHVREALIAARDKADALRASEVQSRHLLYGVLSVDKCGAVKWMLTDGVDRERIDMAAPRSSPALTEPGRYARARIDSDVAEGKELDDLLDIKREVEAICAVIAAVDTSPPLSIGLFGDWGTGKSFFMSRMKDRIDDLKAAARANPDTAYCRNIVQLRFNAWHYMDTDLWASLAAEIFEGLARELDKDRALLEGIEDTAVARARLLAATEHLRDVKTQAERSKADADAALHESEQRLASLSREERDIEARLSPGRIAKEAYRFVAAQPAAAKSLDDAAARIGIPEAKALASDTRATLLELHGVWGGIRALVLALKGGSARLWILLPLTLVLFIASLLALVQWRDRVGPVVIAAATLLGTILGFLKKVIAPTRAALTTIADARGRHDALIQQERARRRNELQQQRDAVQRRVTAEESTITRVTQEIADLEQQLEALRADRQMVAFIQAKNQSTDYTKHFGVIARARHDFERLTDLLKLVTEEAETGAATADAKTGNGAPARPTVPRIDRLILYIDDLDRCPEAKVVDVLQAVHLLLAFPLFIVVVAVDSRWLLHSLRQHTSVFRVDETADGMDDEERVHWQSTPFNYLEKIFQIPFNLRPMDSGGFTRLIDKLTIPKEQRGAVTTDDRTTQPATNGAGTAAPETAATSVTRHDAVTSEGGVSTPTPTPRPPTAPKPSVKQESSGPVAPPTQPGAPLPPARAAHGVPIRPVDMPHASPVDPNPPFLTLTNSEREFMHLMHRLIPTPRAAKRYVNVYRLLRASLPDERRRVLEEQAAGRSRYVLLMLAILTGFPQEGTVILRELVQRKPAGPWWEFVDMLAGENINAAVVASASSRDARAGGTESQQRARARNDAEQHLGAANGDVAAEIRQRAQRWEDLRDRLTEVRRQLGSDDPLCGEFADWAKLVARYSFESGRVLGA